MRLTTRLAAGALMATLVAVPATAQAKPVSKVRAQVTAADRSLHRVVSLVGQNRDNAAATELRNYRRHLRGAERQMRRLRGATGTAAGAKRYGSAVRMVGSVSNNGADAFSFVVDDAAGDPQVAIARAIAASIAIRERVIETLTGLLDTVPAEARPYLAQVIALLSSDGQDEVVGITGALDNPALPADVAGILTQALELATGAIDDAIARLQGIVGMVPGPAQGAVQEALTLVTGQLKTVTTLIEDLFAGLLGGATPVPGTGTGAGGSGGLGGLLGDGLPGLDVLQGILGGGLLGGR
ncbi:MAG: hypothetical protein M3356_04410 [Actinomycetota bacterium]|nr:hypothetical protein [Actinomycetota bacterium]